MVRHGQIEPEQVNDGADGFVQQTPERGQEAVRRYVADRMRTGELRANDPEAFAAAYMALLDRLPIMAMTGLVVPDEEEIASEAANVSRMMAVYAPGGATADEPVGTSPPVAPPSNADTRRKESPCP